MDFTKLIYLLDKRSLFFCRSDKFEDPYEGSYPAKFLLREREVARRYEEEHNYTPPHCIPELRRKLREYVAINCWHMNEHESAAMWNLYLKSDEGVAIRTTWERLSIALKDAQNYLRAKDVPFYGVVPVRYVDFQEDDPNLGEIGAFSLKRKSFEHERELRVVLWRNKDRSIEELEPLPSSGLLVPIDPSVLVDSVYVSPAAPPWFSDLVRSVILKYGLTCSVLQSSIYDNQALY